MTHTGGSFDSGDRSGNAGINLDGNSYVNGEPNHDLSTSQYSGDDGRYFARAFDDASITASTKHFAFDITLDSGVQYNLDKV